MMHKISQKEGRAFTKNQSSPRKNVGSTSYSAEISWRVISKKLQSFFSFRATIWKWQFSEKINLRFFCQRNEKITNLAIKIEEKNIFTKSTVILIYFLLGSFSTYYDYIWMTFLGGDRFLRGSSFDSLAYSV